MNDSILLKKGAESELYLIDWHGAHAISKIRIAKAYRNSSIDIPLRKRRTIHEANILSQVKFFGINTPFIYFLDMNNFEIIMEYIEGKTFKDFFSSDLCINLGEIVGTLHCNNIIHGDITTSNFIVSSNGTIFAIDFGLSFFSERYEDKAADIRLFKEILTSFHVDDYDISFKNFYDGYKKICGGITSKVFRTVGEIEKRGRYSRSEF
ncbi:MAG: Kae1-associated serine/threonine protein kinase [Candidatus Nitrosocosmicus sp.]|nr:Kae1-associated serine/threonine protein kinase [Candidatus Nitrosocosmicus sp.]